MENKDDRATVKETKARKCAEWLAYCLDIGWEKKMFRPLKSYGWIATTTREITDDKNQTHDPTKRHDPNGVD